MANEAAYCCAGLLFLVLVALFAVSMRTNSQTRRYCQQGSGVCCDATNDLLQKIVTNTAVLADNVV